MSANVAEHRQHIRVYFNSLEEASCQFSSVEKSVELLSASVLDLSLGGLHLSVKGGLGLAVGDRLTLNSLAHRAGLVCEEQISMEIRWFFACAEIGRLDIGCQFLSLPEKSQSSIDNLIRMKINEYQNAGSLPIMSA